MDNKFLLDTSIIIGLLRQDRKTQDLIERVKGTTYTSSICLAELYEGIERANNRQKAEKELMTLILPLKIYDFSQGEAVIFGKIRSRLKKLGTVIGDMDLLIAATCLAHNLILVTLNKQHFNRIKGLKLLAV